MNLYKLHTNPEELYGYNTVEPTMTVNSYGDTEYRDFHGELHRNDGPAVITADGVKMWYKNDEQHREQDKPAVIFPNGAKMWYKNGEHHREDGPAVILPNGRKEWWVNGEFTKEEYPGMDVRT